MPRLADRLVLLVSILLTLRRAGLFWTAPLPLLTLLLAPVLLEGGGAGALAAGDEKGS
jgi:hypothetical protein